MNYDTISREAAIAAADYTDYRGLAVEDVKAVTDEVVKELKKLPSADTERKRGRWIDKGEYAECSNCGAYSGTQFDGVEPVPHKTNYCPNCGADMRDKQNE